MTQTERSVIGGVDAHADKHVAAALDERGYLLGTESFSANAGGYGALLQWLEGFGPISVIGVESTGSYACGLVRHLQSYDLHLVEVNQSHAHDRRRRGKSDPIDAEMAARAVLSGRAKAIPKVTSGIVESIRQLRVTRDSAVKSRSAALNQLTSLIVTCPDDIRQQLSVRKTSQGKATLCAKLRPDPRRRGECCQVAKLALRSLGRRIEELDKEISVLDSHLGQLVATAAPKTIALLGVSTGHAGQLLVTAGQNIERIKSEGSFAALCGACPIPVSSGRRDRHRLNYGGDRNANRALHMIAVCRLRYCERTRAYAELRIKAGKTKREIIRQLKRYIAREIFHTLQEDLASLALLT